MENYNSITVDTKSNGTSTTTLGTGTNFNSASNYFWEPNNYTALVGTNTVYLPYYNYWTEPSKIDKAFKLVQRLIENKIIKEPKTVKNFIELVNSLADIV